MAERKSPEDFSDGIESNYDDNHDLLVPPLNDNPMRLSGSENQNFSKKGEEDCSDFASQISRMMFGKERISGVSKTNPLAQNNPRNRRSRHNSNELLAPTRTTGTETLDSSGEDGEGDETILVEKSRDGKPFFEALRHLQVGPHHPSVQEIQTLTSREEDYFRDNHSSTRAVDRSGLDYFAKLDQYWELISRADLVPPKSTDESPEIIFRELSDNSAFTELYETELDLRRRPHRDFPKRKLKHLPQKFDFSDHREYLATHFKNFVRHHDENWNHLQTLVHGQSPSSLLLALTPPLSALHRSSSQEILK
jgi:hypothetical protein